MTDTNEVRYRNIIYYVNYSKRHKMVWVTDSLDQDEDFRPATTEEIEESINDAETNYLKREILNSFLKTGEW